MYFEDGYLLKRKKCKVWKVWNVNVRYECDDCMWWEYYIIYVLCYDESGITFKGESISLLCKVYWIGTQ